MSTLYADPIPEQQTPADGLDSSMQYRTIHMNSVLGAIVGCISYACAAIIFYLVIADKSIDLVAAGLANAMVACGAFGLSLIGLMKIRKNTDVYTGSSFAWAGIISSLLSIPMGFGSATYQFVTEVPDGYQRISFATLKPSAKDEEARRPVPKDAIEVMKTKTPVFIKGYIRPGSTDSRTGATKFLLVRDNNNCCFGDLSKVQYFDQILVTLDEAKSVSTDLSVTRVGGVLVCLPDNLGRGPQYPVYALQADLVE